MNWITEKIGWILGAFVVLISAYFIGRKDGKNAEQNKSAKAVIKMAKSKNDIAANVNNTPVDGLRYRD